MKTLMICASLCAVVTFIGPAHSQESVYEKERRLEQLDEEYKVLQSQRARLKAVIDELPSQQQISAIKIDEKLLEIFKSLPVQIQEFLGIYEQLKDKEAEEDKTKLREAWNQLKNNLIEFTDDWGQNVSRFSTRYEFGYGDDETSREYQRLARKHGSASAYEGLRPMGQIQTIRTVIDNFSVSDLNNVISESLPQAKIFLESIGPRIQQFLDPIRQGAEAEIKPIDTRLDELSKERSELEKSIGEEKGGQISINQTLITWTLPIFGATLIAIFLLPSFFKERSQRTALESGLILEMATVYLLVSTILFLGIAGILKSEVLGALIGGISGYVLGRWRRGEQGAQEPDATQTAPPSGTPPSTTTRLARLPRSDRGEA